jgi:hypothetical protein
MTVAYNQLCNVKRDTFFPRVAPRVGVFRAGGGLEATLDSLDPTVLPPLPRPRVGAAFAGARRGFFAGTSSSSSDTALFRRPAGFFAAGASTSITSSSLRAGSPKKSSSVVVRGRAF